MPWKLDDSKNVVLGTDGNPVWITEGGEEKSVDYPGLTKRLSEVNSESNNRKQEIRALKEKLSVFDGIDDLKAWKDEALQALEFRKNAPDKDKELEAQIKARLDAESAKFQAQLAARDKSISDKDRLLQEQAVKISQMSIGADVKSSKIMERVKPETKALLEREMTRAGALDDEGKIYYRNAEGKPFYNAEGQYATREEAPLMLLKELGIDSAAVLISQDGHNGSGGHPNGGTGGAGGGGKRYSEMSQSEKIAYLKNPANLK